MNVVNTWGGMTFENGRWTLDVRNVLRITDALIAVKLSGEDVSTSREWKLISKESGRQSDPLGESKSVSIVFSDETRQLRIEWNTLLYEKVPVTAFSMSVNNESKDDKLIKYLAPLHACAASGSSVTFCCGAAEEFSVIPNGLWMDVDAHIFSLNENAPATSWWCSFLGHKPTGNGIAVGIGERANTQTRIVCNAQGESLDIEVAGEMDVNRHEKPFSLKPGRQFRMNRCILVWDRDILGVIERYADSLQDYAEIKLRFPPYTGLFSAYGQDPQGRRNFFEFPLTTKRVKDLMTVLENHISDYGIDYVKTQFGGLSSGPGTEIAERRQWTSKPVFPETSDFLPELIREKGFTPDTFDMKKHHPGGICALSDEVHSRSFKHALVCRPFLNVEGGTAERDRLAGQIFKMAVEEWRYDYLMFDFVCCDYENDEDDTVTMAEGIMNRFQAIRNAVGSDIFIEACMMMWGPVIGLADGFRPVRDWRGGTEAKLADAFATRFFLHGKLFQLDLEFFHPAFRPFNWGESDKDPIASLDRVRSWVSFSALSGTSYLTGGVLEKVSDERWHIFSRAMPVYGKSAVPVDILHAETPRIWKLDAESAGSVHTVVGLFNWNADDFETVRVDFEKCSLSQGKKYILFDFWEGRMIGIFSEKYSVSIAPSTCQMLFVHEYTDTPVVIGDDRHVTGTVGLKHFTISSGEISGVSEGPPGRQITHYVYLPGGYSPGAVSNCECEVEQVHVLRVRVKFEGSRSKERKIVSKRWKIKLDSGAIVV